MPKPGAKERIIDTACRLFYHQGYNLTGINQIIEEAEVAKASLYQHFRSKEELAIAYLKFKHEEWEQVIKEFLDQFEDPKDKLIAVFDFLEKWQIKDELGGCNFLNMISEIPAHERSLYEQVVYHKESEKRLYQMMAENAGINNYKRIGEQISILVQGALIETKLKGNLEPIKNAKEVAKSYL